MHCCGYVLRCAGEYGVRLEIVAQGRAVLAREIVVALGCGEDGAYEGSSHTTPYSGMILGKARQPVFPATNE